MTNHSNTNGDQNQQLQSRHTSRRCQNTRPSRQTRIQKTTLRNEAYADVRRERRSHNFNNGGTKELRLRSTMTKRSLNDGGTQESRQTRQAHKLISEQRRNTGIAFTEESNNEEGTLKPTNSKTKSRKNRKTKNIKMTNKYRKKYWLVYLNSGIYGTHSITQSHTSRMSTTTQSRTFLKNFHGNFSITTHCNVHISK